MVNLLFLAVKKLLSKLAVTMIGDAFIEWAFFHLADRIVKSTATPHDDEWLAKLKEEYKK